MGVPGHRLDRMFNPKTVVVIGDKGPGYMWLRNNLPFKEQGGNLYSVQIDETQIPGIEEMGITNFKSLNDIPEPVDYALVAVPRQVAPYVMKDLLEAQVGGAAFFTSGFAETGEELGIQLQDALTKMAREANFPLVGPNCMGLYLPKVGVRFSADVPVTKSGKVGFLAQSGTHCIMFGLVGSVYGVEASRAASFGNAIALDVSDYIEYLADDDETEVIGAYIEGVKDGRRFFEVLKDACSKKPVVIWKGGQTDAGARATMSHTGSLATSQAIWEGMMRQCGAISTDNLDETIDVMQLLLKTKPPKSKKFALAAMTGGNSVSITDAFAKEGLEIPPLSERSYADLGEFFNIVGGSYKNPLDMALTIAGQPDMLDRVLRILEHDPEVDGIALELNAMFGTRQWKENPETLEKTLAAMAGVMERSDKTFICVMHPAHEEAYVAGIRPKFNELNIPVFSSFDRAAKAVARVERYTARRA